MPTLITLTEAATFLGVSKATLRNWDNDGKLVAVRNPINGYRQYDMESLIKLKNEMTGQENSLKKQNDELKSEEAKAIKRAVNKLHCIIRDSDANSNIVTRFDEISKLLFVRLMSGRNIFEGFEQKDALYSSKIQCAMITEIDFKVTGEERKKLAYAIGETLGLPVKYTRTPR